MTFTRKHYKVIANQVAENLYREVVTWFKLFGEDNKAFSQEKFMAALASRLEQLIKEDE